MSQKSDDGGGTSPQLENATESATPMPRGTRGRRGTPTKLEKTESPLKGRGQQRTTRGQKRAATSLADDEKDEKGNDDEGTATTRPNEDVQHLRGLLPMKRAGKGKRQIRKAMVQMNKTI